MKGAKKKNWGKSNFYYFEYKCNVFDSLEYEILYGKCKKIGSKLKKDRYSENFLCLKGAEQPLFAGLNKGRV